MENWKLRQQAVVAEKHRKFLEELGHAGKDQMREMLARLVEDAPLSYHILLKNPVFGKLAQYVLDETRFLPVGAKMSTRCWYAVNGVREAVRCHNCGRPLSRDIKATEKSKAFWCGPKCQGEDPYMRDRIRCSKFKAGRRYTESKPSQLPPPRVIDYVPILYDDAANAMVLDIFNRHRRQFGFWIDKEPGLKKYLFEKSYPIDGAGLKVETRVKWIIDKMQKFPVCKACGRPIDFVDVKVSGKWPAYCCVECKKRMQGAINYNRHASEIYQRMAQSEWTRPLFTLDEFKAANRRTCRFEVECLKCGGKFALPFDLNFYARAGRKSYFRCPDCFPFLGRRKKSKEESEIYEYVSSIAGAGSVVRGDRSAIYPLELDVHPTEEYSDIAIEYNGVYWHSVEGGRAEKHVLDKVIMCENVGIRLITIWEDEFLADKKYWFEFIDDVFRNPEKIVERITDAGRANIFEVDRSIFNKAWEFPGYRLREERPPCRVVRRVAGKPQAWTTFNAGSLIYEKQPIEP